MRRAVYAGTFDPITCGHLSVVERGLRLFDQVIVVVAHNPLKTPLFSPDERVEMIREATARWPEVECTSTAGYVVELARARGARHLLRGVRGSTDVDAEIALASLNHGLAPEIETVFVPARPDLAEVSSSRLKEMALRGEDLARFCPAAVARRLRERLGTSPAKDGHVPV